MNWLIPASVATAIGVALLASVKWYLYCRYRQKFMLIWAIAWTALFLRYFCLLGEIARGKTTLLELGYYGFVVINAALLLVGSSVFLGRRTPRWVLFVSAGILGWIFIAVTGKLPSPWLHFPVFFFLAVSDIVVGTAFLQSRKQGGTFVGILFILWGLHQADYPLLRPIAWFAPWGYLIGATLSLSSALAIIVLYFERTYCDLRESHEQYRSMLATTNDGFWIVDEQGHVQDVNHALCQLTGYTRDELLTMSVHDLDVIEDQQAVRRHIENIKQNLFDRFETRHRRKDGCVVDLEISTTLLPGRGRIIAFLRDITSRKRADEALRQSEERFRVIAANTPDHIIIQDRGLRYTFVVNPQLGLTEADMIGKTDHDFLNKDEAEKLTAIKRGVLETGEPFYLDVPLLNRKGEIEQFDGVFIPKRDSTGMIDGLIGYFRNVTERRRADEEKARLEAQLQQAQKLESVGRLAGGVAHDFNNMLGVILGHTEMLLDQAGLTQPLRMSMEEIHKAATRSANLTRQLLAFARKQTVMPKVLDLNCTVDGTISMLKRLIGEDIELAWAPGKDLWPVKVDPTQIDQILTNLCVNARDAIAGVGKITIETTNRVLNADYCADHRDCQPGEYVRLTVADTGCGVDKATLTHIFEPFFTTKDIGKGTGLGLAMVYGAVRQNNGFITAQSEPRQGMTLSIYLPRYSGDTLQAGTGTEAMPASRGCETILLVEDDPAVLKMVPVMLSKQGYTVLAASTPGEAIRIASTHAEQIHLLMTDVIMPEMNGRDLARQLVSLHPHLKCLFMSGYTADVIAHHGVLDAGVAFLEKPFSTTELADKVRAALGGERTVS